MLLDQIRQYPVIDSHEHYTYPVLQEGFPRLLLDYALADLLSSAGKGASSFERRIFDSTLSVSQRAELIERQYAHIRHTSYGRMLFEGLRIISHYPEAPPENERMSISELLISSDQRLGQYTAEQWNSLLAERTTIETKIVDQFNTDCTDLILRGGLEIPRGDRLSFPLPSFHHLVTKGDIERLQRYTDEDIHSLDSYLTVFGDYLSRAAGFGVCAVKDQCAYYRSLRFPKSERSEAERLFGRIVSDPRDCLNAEEQLILENYLFHGQLRIIEQLGLPVQMHTGHMAGIRNDVSKANAIGLISVLEEYQNVHFDLFHGNWPYMDEYLFIGKNYPNVSLDLCWAHTIDPEYTRQFIIRAVKTIPSNKLIGFGGDSFHPAFTLVYERQAKEVIATSLEELVKSGWLTMTDAEELAHQMLYDTPKEIFL